MIKTGKNLYGFGPFRIDPNRRQLWRENRSVPLHPKTFDILLVLVQNSERVVLKDDLMKTVWPDTFVEESNLSQNISLLRKTLGDSIEERRYIVTIPGRGYRFAEKVEVIEDGTEQSAPAKITPDPPLETVAGETIQGRTLGEVLPANVGVQAQGLAQDHLVVESHTRSRLIVEEQLVSAKSLPAKRQGLRLTVVSATVLAVLVGAGAYFRLLGAPKLTEKDTVVLGDFDNRTGDQVFDGTLRQGLSAQLEQSPFLNLLSDRRIAETFKLMTQPKDAHLTPELAREVCQRTASAAVLDGSIAQIGSRYLLTLKASACSTGETLASVEAEAQDKNHILDAMGKIAFDIRRKLGESLASIQKYDVRPEDVTTPSLEALHSYSLAMKNRNGNYVLFSQLMKRAIEQDPNFAAAYAQLGVGYINIGETEQGVQYIRKAYDLRDHVSEREKLYIASHYDNMVNGDLEAARKDYEVWEEIYPHDLSPYSGLATVYYLTGDYEKLLPMVKKGSEMSGISSVSGYPGSPNIGVIWGLTFLNQIDEAKAMALKGQAQTHDPLFDLSLYQFAFLQGDDAARQHELEILVGNPTWGDGVLDDEAGTMAYVGKFTKSRELLRRAVETGLKHDKKESAASYYAQAALVEALAGNAAQAKQFVKQAMAVAGTKDTRAVSALALSLAGDTAEAAKIADDLGKRYPKDTIIQSNFLPTIGAASQLWNERNRVDGQKAIQLLAVTTPYEFGVTALDNGICLYPVFVRAQGYLASGQGPAAAAEFQKIVDYRQMVQMQPIGAIAYLGLGRAYALSHDSAKAKSEYQTFLNLWKDADPDIPILRQAKVEYAKLQ
jgi:eukaryotic-like serine/threonine-protein kinase